MKITMYDLLVLIKEGKAPKKIKFKNEIYEYKNQIKDNFIDYIGIEKETDVRFYLSSQIGNGYINDIFTDEVEIIEEKPTVEKSEDRIEKALEFLETQYNTYPNGEMWRGALKNILQGKSADDVYEPFIEDNKKLEKIDFKTLNTQKEKNRAMKDAINKIIDEINKLKESE